MNKEEIVNKMSVRTGLSKRDACAALEALMEIICESMEAGESVHLHGFGNFQTRKTKPRVGRNLITKDKVDIPSRVVPVFKPGVKMVTAAGKSVDSYVGRQV